MKIVDISDLNNPVVLSHLVISGDIDAFWPFEDENLVIIGAGAAGIYIYNYTDKTNPVKVAEWQLPYSPGR